jgi:pimeloyl-ACP methyl ester carboxylesterase
MSLGGLTAIRLGSIASDLVHGLVIVDVSPASPARHKSMEETDRETVAWIDGPAVYDSLLRWWTRQFLDCETRAGKHC